MIEIQKGACISCKFRHSCCPYDYPWDEPCKHWKIGPCYSCIYNTEDEMTEEETLEWFKRGCDAEYPGGCKKYKRNWKKFFNIRKRIV